MGRVLLLTVLILAMAGCLAGYVSQFGPGKTRITGRAVAYGLAFTFFLSAVINLVSRAEGS